MWRAAQADLQSAGLGRLDSSNQRGRGLQVCLVHAINSSGKSRLSCELASVGLRKISPLQASVFDMLPE